MFRRFAFAIAATLCCSTQLMADQLTVFAAASLKTALEEASVLYEKTSGHEVTLSFAGSSVLARQIELGAPADIFISANPNWMDTLEASNAIDAASRIDLLGNDLVLIAHGDLPEMPLSSDTDFGSQRIAMALVQAVPAGIYGRQALQSLGLWQKLAPQVVQTDNVRAALSLVARGEVPFGVVYATDATASDKISIVFRFPSESHAPIVYPAAAVSRSESPVAADFLRFLSDTAAGQVFRRHGFTLLSE